MDLLTGWDNERQCGDLVMGDNALAQDQSLLTAIVISLFTNRRAKPDDQLPYADGNRRGWWGDKLAEREGDKIGSRLWLLWREKVLQVNLTRAREYALEALQWLIDDGHAAKIEVEAEEAQRGVLGLKVMVTDSNAERQEFYFEAAERGWAMP